MNHPDGGPDLADTAICEPCLAELFDPRSRRYRYPFIDCPSCGPRFTLLRELPYARANTTMAAFAMCAACAREVAEPADRRFRAEGNSCPACGPRLSFELRNGTPLPDDAGLRAAQGLLAEGGVLALKGPGGYQLACDAANEAAVSRLRARKMRPDEPFALMAAHLEALEELVELDGPALEALTSAARPIVLAPARAEAPIAGNVAPRRNPEPRESGRGGPDSRELGVMLPSAPLHHLLFAGAPRVLVMTGGNLAAEPIAKDDDDARLRLAPLADGFLLHDRALHSRADDSVVQVSAGAVQPLRRARGFVPRPIAIPLDGPCVLGVGGQERSTICLAGGGEAFLSQHLGALGSPLARAFFAEAIEKLQRLAGVAPIAVAHDLDADYVSTRWAQARGLPLIGVQHHHAHVAACLAENGVSTQAIGVAFDGAGSGPSGELWGGEILRANLAGFSRLGTLRSIQLLGGEAASREPWRLALAALVDAGEPIGAGDWSGALHGVDQETAARAAGVLSRGGRTPSTSSAGRWFDAAAALLGVRARVTYDSQAALELEALARRAGPTATPLPFLVEDGPCFQIDLRPAIRELCAAMRAGADRAWLALRFHETLAAVVERSCLRARDLTGLTQVALSGGCFQNRILTGRALARLAAAGFTVFLHREVPPNDSGLALGQAAVASARLRSQTGA